MITFCDEEEIELVLIEVPRQDWTDAQHNGMQSIADEYNLNFLDFNYSPYIDEIDYNTAIDSIEGYHLNYYGSTKLTEWIGNYLITFCNVTDVRGSSEYEFLQDELDSYKKSIIDVKLDEFTDVSDYLLYVSEQDNLSALITIKTEATLSLTEEQRAQFVECGLTNLSELDYRNSYIGIIENGEVIFEETSLGESVETEVLDDSTAKLNDLYSIEDTVTEMFHLETDNITNETLYLEFNGNLIDGTSIVLQSGGYYQGNISSCIIGGIEYSMNSRGINIVVYNNETQTVVDTACFDTCISPMRSSQNTEIALNNLLEDGMTVDQLTGVYREVYLYNLRCEDAYTIEILNNSIDETGLYQYLTTFWNDDDYAIFLSVQNDASSALDTIARTALSELGLNALSSLNTQDSYLAIIDGGEVIVENSSPDGSYLTEELLDYVIVSGTTDSGETSSIKIDGTEYSPKSDGINVVVYNKTTNLLVDARTFNTGLYPVTIEGGE